MVFSGYYNLWCNFPSPNDIEVTVGNLTKKGVQCYHPENSDRTLYYLNNFSDDDIKLMWPNGKLHVELKFPWRDMPWSGEFLKIIPPTISLDSNQVSLKNEENFVVHWSCQPGSKLYLEFGAEKLTNLDVFVPRDDLINQTITCQENGTYSYLIPYANIQDLAKNNDTIWVRVTDLNIFHDHENADKSDSIEVLFLNRMRPILSLNELVLGIQG